MSLFAVNTVCRDAEICKLRWAAEERIQRLSRSVFIIRGELLKNGDERLAVLNRIAKSVVDSLWGQHETNMFTFKGYPVRRMLNTGWQKARVIADLPQVSSMTENKPSGVAYGPLG